MPSKTASSVAVRPATILEIALDEGTLSTFVKAVQASARLAHVLSGEGPYTVFAPDNFAFKQYANHTRSELLSDQEKFTTLLTFHIVPGRFFSTDLKKKQTLISLLGKELNVDIWGGDISVGYGNIIQSDMECNNGVLHIIDSVLVPR